MDGSLDVSSLLSHIALLEQALENKASADDMTRVQDELKSTKLEVAALKNQLNQCSCSSSGSQNSASSSEVRTLQTDVGHLKQEVVQLQSLHNTSSGTSTNVGSTFTRWGRTSCPADSNIVYKGYTGGTWYSDKGGASTLLCLTKDPIYAAHTIVHHNESSHIYGTEYQTSYNGNPFQHLTQDDMPCVVCESSRSSSVMIPGRNQCYPGWTVEYWGYLMGGAPNHSSAEYICVDSHAEAIPGGKANENGRTLFIVESQCGSLPCPPYTNDWEVSCVVCSK